MPSGWQPEFDPWDLNGGRRKLVFGRLSFNLRTVHCAMLMHLPLLRNKCKEMTTTKEKQPSENSYMCISLCRTFLSSFPKQYNKLTIHMAFILCWILFKALVMSNTVPFCLRDMSIYELWHLKGRCSELKPRDNHTDFHCCT